MSEDLYAEPGITNKVYCGQDDRESMVNIYVSAESLKVYDNPWVEGTSPNTPAEIQQPVVSENSGKRNHVRADLVILGVMCLLLLAGIICLWVHMNKNKTSWRREKDQLLEDKASLMKMNYQLKANITELIRDNADLLEEFCKHKPMKCKHFEKSEGTGKGRMGHS
ncbi:uncharacterized protein LOC117254628 [Epinephelus lanceolatus]